VTSQDAMKIRARRLAQIRVWDTEQHPGDGTDDVPELAEDVFFLLGELRRKEHELNTALEFAKSSVENEFQEA
jgi:hypothetical protein